MSESTESSTAPAPTVWPTFRARDAHALITFLCDAFGFERAVVYNDGDVVQHAELRWPEGGGVMLGSARDDNDAHVAAPGSSSAYVVTADPDAVHARAVAAGATITREPFDTDYGSRDFAAVDPEGNRWSFGSYAGHG
ncbi:VOC family protein [Jatrophihabitans sp. YIM 134969]